MLEVMFTCNAEHVQLGSVRKSETRASVRPASPRIRRAPRGGTTKSQLLFDVGCEPNFGHSIALVECHLMADGLNRSRGRGYGLTPEVRERPVTRLYVGE
ncbi:hypothetical protein BN2475_950001 [Paraburkholderia ribeironis]|uniref:Uncharacterized protein n=1 Tax=Paraburkholderia ribeironis TaxID=1247936 RepID=A0A1N7SLF0_9BURK|nr:hypothetical protein BN2475_950001 [Paraburkholderia ribeironis]